MKTPSQRAYPRLLASLAALVLLAAPAHAYRQVPSISIDEKSGIELELALPFTEQPPSGFFPARLKIRNRTNQAHDWVVTWGTGSSGAGSVLLTHRSVVTVEAGQAREFDLLVPRAGMESSHASGFDMFRGSVKGYGVRTGQFYLHSSSSGGIATAFVAISDTLAASAWSKLETELRSAGAAAARPHPLASDRFASTSRSAARALSGSPVNLDEMPADARAFSGIAGLWVTDTDWLGLPARRRAAIRQWVTEGGNLFVACKDEPRPMADLPADLRFEASTAVGFGAVKLVRLTAGELPLSETVQEIVALDGAPLPHWREDFQTRWNAAASVGRPLLNVPLIIGFVCVFAIVIGPLNLLWFAPAQRRPRLFLTVPLISALASVALLGVIAFGDGIGGLGVRNALMFLPAGENRATLVQEQVARSRLLLARGLSVPEEAVVSFVPLQRNEDQSRSLQRTGTALAGDWFRSRSVQAHTLRMSVPSRAEVVLQPPKIAGTDAPPVLLSSVPAALRRVFYIDAARRYWSADELATGRPAELKPSTRSTFERWLDEASRDLSPGVSALLARVEGRPGHFYAFGDPMPGAPLETLRSITWERQTVVCFGPCGGVEMK